MTLVIARFGGLALALVAVAVGVLMGRIIEAIAVAAVLYTAWIWVRGLAAADADTPQRDAHGRTG